MRVDLVLILGYHCLELLLVGFFSRRPRSRVSPCAMPVSPLSGSDFLCWAPHSHPYACLCPCSPRKGRFLEKTGAGTSAAAAPHVPQHPFGGGFGGRGGAVPRIGARGGGGGGGGGGGTEGHFDGTWTGKPAAVAFLLGISFVFAIVVRLACAPHASPRASRGLGSPCAR